MVRLSDGEKFEGMFTPFNNIQERDGRMDGRTDRRTDGRTDTTQRHRPRLCIASRGNDVTNYRVKQ